MTTTCTMILGDCLDVMPTLHPFSLVIADLPFAASKYEWDQRIDLIAFWRSIGKASCVAFANRAFMQELIASNPTQFRYELIWDQMRGWTPLLAKHMPMRSHTYLCIFGKTHLIYTPQKTGDHPLVRAKFGRSSNLFYKNKRPEGMTYCSRERYPTSVLCFASDKKKRNNKHGNRQFTPTHPSAKPVGLYEWIIKTYSFAKNHVIDPTSGCASSSIASLNCGRNITSIEKDPYYFEAGVERVRKHVKDNAIDATIEVRT